MKSFTKHRTLVRKKVYQPNRHKQYTHYEIELILFLQTQWKLYYYFSILPKLILLQKNIKGWFTRKLLKEISSLNYKIRIMIMRIQLVIFLHSFRCKGIKLKKRLPIKRPKPLTKKFLKLQRKIHRFLLLKTIKRILSHNDLSGLSIKSVEYNKRPLKCFYHSIFLLKKIRPISKILRLQKNIRYFYFSHKPKPSINKALFISNYLFTKCIKQYKLAKKHKTHNESNEQNEGLIPIKKPKKSCYFTKKIIYMIPLINIQRFYKERYQIRKRAKIDSNAHQIIKASFHECFIDKVHKYDKMNGLLIVQNAIKYFLFRLNQRPNSINKVYLNRMVLTKETIIKKTNTKKISKNVQVFLYVLRKIFDSHNKREFMKKLKGDESAKDPSKKDYNFNYDDVTFKVIKEEEGIDINSNLKNLINSSNTLNKRKSREGSIRSQIPIKFSPKKFSIPRNIDNTNKRSLRSDSLSSNMSQLTLSRGDESSSPRTRKKQPTKEMRKSKYSSRSNQ